MSDFSAFPFPLSRIRQLRCLSLALESVIWMYPFLPKPCHTAFSKNGGNLGASGAVSHGFDRMGLITYPAKVGDADTVFEAALDAGADIIMLDELNRYVSERQLQ